MMPSTEFMEGLRHVEFRDVLTLYMALKESAEKSPQVAAAMVSAERQIKQADETRNPWLYEETKR